MTYAGTTLTLPLGTEGLTGSESLTILRPTQLVEARNVRFQDGLVQKENGSDKYNSAAISGAPTIVAGWDWWPTATVQRMIVLTDDNELLRDTGDGLFGTTLATGVNVANVPFFVEGGKEASANNRKLFFFNGNQAPRVLSGDGVTVGNLATPAADWTGTDQPGFGAIHVGRLWAAGNANDPYRVYYSNPADHEDFTGAGSGSISVYPGEGEYLTAIVPYKIANNDILLAFKYPRGVYLIDTSDVTVTNWRVSRITDAVGLLAIQGWALIGNDDALVWIDPNGHFRAATSLQEFGNVRSNDLGHASTIAPFIRQATDLGRMDKARLVYYAHKNEVHVCLTSPLQTVHDRRLMIDFNGETPRFQMSDHDINESIWLRKDSDNIQRLMIGDDAGFVWELDQPNKNQDGLPFEASVRTTDTDFAFADPSFATRRKNGQFLEMIFERTDAVSTVLVDVFWDFVYHETLIFTTRANGAPFGTFTLDVDKLGPIDAGNRSKVRLHGGGRRFAMRPYVNEIDGDFRMAGARISFTLGAERE